MAVVEIEVGTVNGHDADGDEHEAEQKQRPVEVRNQAPVNLHGFRPRRGTSLFSTGRILQLDEFFENLLRHRRRGLTAMPAVLDQNGDRDLRRFPPARRKQTRHDRE